MTRVTLSQGIVLGIKFLKDKLTDSMRLGTRERRSENSLCRIEFGRKMAFVNLFRPIKPKKQFLKSVSISNEEKIVPTLTGCNSILSSTR